LWYWGLNPGTHACKATTWALLQPFCLYFVLRKCLDTFAEAFNSRSSCLHLLNSWDYGHTPWCLAGIMFNWFFSLYLISEFVLILV
jgi:hypothetical protein